jgi:hypothetical protein
MLQTFKIISTKGPPKEIFVKPATHTEHHGTNNARDQTCTGLSTLPSPTLGTELTTVDVQIPTPSKIKNDQCVFLLEQQTNTNTVFSDNKESSSTNYFNVDSVTFEKKNTKIVIKQIITL